MRRSYQAADLSQEVSAAGRRGPGGRGGALEWGRWRRGGGMMLEEIGFFKRALTGSRAGCLADSLGACCGAV
jgi:hypothetical protein